MRYTSFPAIAIVVIASTFTNDSIDAQQYRGAVSSSSSGHSFVFADSDMYGNRLPVPIFGQETDSRADDQSSPSDEVVPDQVSIEDYLRPISDVTIDARAPEPDEDQADGDPIDKPDMFPPTINYSTDHRNWALSTLFWQVPDTYRHPLYFEDRVLERCGCNRGYHIQPKASGIKFIADAVTWPCKMRRLHPKTCIYAQCNRYNCSRLFHD